MPGDNRSRAKRNKDLRRENLREELKSREYLRQAHDILKKLDSPSLERVDIQRFKVKLDGLLALLRKTLPDLKSMELEATFTEAKPDRLALEATLKAAGIDPATVGGRRGSCDKALNSGGGYGYSART